LKVLACGRSAVYVLVYTITCVITRAAFNNLSHKFLLLGTVIFAELADVFRVSLNYEG